MTPNKLDTAFSLTTGIAVPGAAAAALLFLGMAPKNTVRAGGTKLMEETGRDRLKFRLSVLPGAGSGLQCKSGGRLGA